jgi:hypothetical protein
LILVDTSVWVDHLRRGEPGLVGLLERSAVLMHPFVVGELACGSLRSRASILELLQDLPAAVVASPGEVLQFVESRALHGMGIGYVDVHLLASVALTPGAKLWTRDAKLRRIAAVHGCAHPEPAH